MDVYFLGLLFGIFLRKCKDGKIIWAYKMKWYYQLLGWTMAIFFLVGSLFGPHVYYNHDDPHYYSQAQFKHNIKNIISAIFWTSMKNFSSFYVSTFRMAWALGLAWVLFAAEFGYCPPIKWGLSLYIWNLIGKLSYAIYLVHIYVYTLYYFQTRQGMGGKFMLMAMFCWDIANLFQT